MTCPSCKSEAAGNFCSNCGAPLLGAACAACRAPLTPGAKFCHRCGTPAGLAAATRQSGVGNALPWSVAAIALLALIALAAGQRFNRPRPTAEESEGVPSMAGSPRAPDISSLTPAQRAE